jgi:hypothetical protein
MKLKNKNDEKSLFVSFKDVQFVELAGSIFPRCSCGNIYLVPAKKWNRMGFSVYLLDRWEIKVPSLDWLKKNALCLKCDFGVEVMK